MNEVRCSIKVGDLALERKKRALGNEGDLNYNCRNNDECHVNNYGNYCNNNNMVTGSKQSPETNCIKGEVSCFSFSNDFSGAGKQSLTAEYNCCDCCKHVSAYKCVCNNRILYSLVDKKILLGLYVHLTLGGKRFTGLLDTGASISLIDMGIATDVRKGDRWF